MFDFVSPVDVSGFVNIGSQDWRDERGNAKTSSYVFDEASNLIYIVRGDETTSSLCVDASVFALVIPSVRPNIMQRRALNYLKDRGIS